MSNEKVFPKGVRVFAPHQKAPSFIKASLVITLNELVKFCKENPALLSEYNGEKQIKLQMQESKDGKLMIVVDTYKRENASVSEVKDDLPF